MLNTHPNLFLMQTLLKKYLQEIAQLKEELARAKVSQPTDMLGIEQPVILERAEKF